ncbi:glutamine-hydrolyzing GMP synthase [Patescibacteria group bacterium]|nr:glutamine-hydrolyzing GMP synthase [Patescibacteria group bacterium]
MDKIAVLDFGGQYAHLIANRIRRLNVYSEILDCDTSAENFADYKGIILSGGPQSVYAENSPQCDAKIFNLGIPVLGICYGHQIMNYKRGGEVSSGKIKEYGQAKLNILKKEGIFEGLNDEEIVWMSHGDEVASLPAGTEIIGSTDTCKYAAVADFEKKLYGIQFHTEVTHTKNGMKILDNFLNICAVKREWDLALFIEQEMENIKKKVGDKKVFMLISGGVDSTVAYALIQKAIGAEYTRGLFVNTGLIRMHEQEEVEKAYKDAGIQNVQFYDASAEFLSALKDKYEPEEKRKIIGNTFLEVKRKVANDLNLNPNEWLLGQGTIYPDTIETGGTKHADKIKTHHNRVEQIEQLIREGKVIEPLQQLYKDEVREVGSKLGVPAEIVWRHPFPGPGLGVRILCSKGDDYPENSATTEREINKYLEPYGMNGKILPIKSVGVQGDARTYRHPFVIELHKDSNHDWKTLGEIATGITNRFANINRVLLMLAPHGIVKMNAKPGYLTQDRVTLLQKVDYRVTEFIKYHKMYSEIWQFPTVLIPLSLNNRNGESIVLRPICSDEAMTASFYPMKWDWVNELTTSIEAIDGVDGVFYDLTNKPPGTIEWE